MVENKHRIFLIPPNMSRAGAVDAMPLGCSNVSSPKEMPPRWGCESPKIREKKNLQKKIEGVLQVSLGGEEGLGPYTHPFTQGEIKPLGRVPPKPRRGRRDHLLRVQTCLTARAYARSPVS